MGVRLSAAALDGNYRGGVRSLTSTVFLYSLAAMPSRRVRFRPPGVKPWTRIGPLGPFRGRLGLAWVIAPMVVGVAVLVAGWLYLSG